MLRSLLIATAEILFLQAPLVELLQVIRGKAPAAVAVVARLLQARHPETEAAGASSLVQTHSTQDLPR
jgi:hypothetical protein